MRLSAAAGVVAADAVGCYRSSAVAEQVCVRNAATDAAARGWLLGHFTPPGDPRSSDDVEINCGVHPAGERRPGWVTDDPRSMLSVLVSGRFRIDLPDRSVVLAAGHRHTDLTITTPNRPGR